MTRLTVHILLAVLVSATVQSTVLGAGSSDYSRAVSLYLSDKYSEALPILEACGNQDPRNANVHYYLALCCLRLGDRARAAAEYELVLKHTKSEAQREIVQARLRRIKPQLSGGGYSSRPAPTAANHGPVRRVIWFSTNWCSMCKRFAPVWEQAKSHYHGRIVFESLNAEDPANWKFVEIFRPKAYPTLVFLDGQGRVIDNRAGAPMGNAFATYLQMLGAGK